MASPNSEHATGILIMMILLSFIISSSLNVYPLSPSMAALRPMVMIMVLIFWLLFQPRYVGILIAFVIGISADLLMDTRLGQQAFSAVVVAVVIRFSSIYIKQVNAASAWLIATGGLLAFQLTLWILQLITQSQFVAQSGLSLLMSIISWPLVLLALRKFTR